MNASERLQAIIRERLEGQTFGWGPVLAVWAIGVAARMIVDVWGGPTILAGATTYGIILVFQVLWSWRKKASPSVRSWPLQGLWILLAPACWFLGSIAPALGLLTVQAGVVLELFFLAGGEVQTGIMKGRRSLWIGGLVLGVGSLALATFPVALPFRAALVLGALGIPAYIAHRSDQH